MKIYQNILETIGNTPMVQVQKITSELPCPVLIKMETFNPGHSIKDRMALKMLLDAEANGNLKPGGTIIECTSGNTGMGLALAGVVRGYRCIFTTNDKQSKEKVDMLKALGAEVIVCPTSVGPEDPRSYYSVAERLSKEIPNSYWFNQYDNLSNRQAHYESTGLGDLGSNRWEDHPPRGRCRHRWDHQRNIQVPEGAKPGYPGMIDTFGSVFKKYHETGEFDEKEIYPYITEWIGEIILPKNVEMLPIDHFEKVTDKDGALMARRLAREEANVLL